MNFSPRCSEANKGTPASYVWWYRGVRNWVAMAEMDYDSIHATASKRLCTLHAMTEECAEVLASGGSVPSVEAKEIFLSRLPFVLASGAFKTEWKT
ncbi:hypothetical protein Efla_001500 [Eimeria flavescens]